MKKLIFLGILALITFFAPAVAYADSRTTTTWTSSDTTGINVIPYVRIDKKALFVDFDHFTSDMDYVYYNLNYTDKNTNVKGGIEGSFITKPLDVYGNFGGFDYVRRQLLFGTCSNNTCTYNNPKSVTLTVNTHFSKGQVAQYTKVLSFPDDQF